MRMKFLLAVSALATLGACATTPPVDIKPVERISSLTSQSADGFAERGMYAEAAIAYRSVLQSKGEDAAVRFGLAEALRKGGKVQEAKAEYAKLADVPDWKMRAFEGVGLTELAFGDRNAARAAFDQVVLEDVKAWKSWLGLAQIHDFDKEWAKADEAYALALSSTTQPAMVYNNQGLSRLARGEPAWAADHFRLALATDPTMERTRTNLEIAEAAMGATVQKVSASERDARERARKLNNAGYVAMMRGRPEEARAFYEAALESHPSFYAQAFQNLQALNVASPKKVVPFNE